MCFGEREWPQNDWQCIELYAFPWFALCFGGRAWPQNHGKCCEFYTLPWFGLCFGVRGCPRTIENALNLFIFMCFHGFLSRQCLWFPESRFENEEGSRSTDCAYPAHIPRISFEIVCGSRPFKALTPTGVVPES